MKVLVIGSCGREHALVWKIAQSPKVDKIYCAPGNAGTAEFAENVNIKVDDIAGLLNFAQEKKIDLTVVGPEIPLVLGVVDEFDKAGLKAFGPSKAAAQLEGSKAFAKNIMVKYDGLAAGKGVLICQTTAEAITAVKDIMEKKEFGSAGDTVVIEECLVGEEASILALTDGKSIVPLETSQDHKRIYDGDKGPNTGGMGAYSPAPVITDHLMSQIDVEVLRPLVAGMAQEGIPYKGIIYAGIMVTKQGPKVLEFNCRFGDPETQPVLMRMKSDLVPIFEAVIDGKLNNREIEWHEKAAVCVVIAAGGYPGKYEKGMPITGIDKVDQLANAYG